MLVRPYWACVEVACSEAVASAGWPRSCAKVLLCRGTMLAVLSAATLTRSNWIADSNCKSSLAVTNRFKPACELPSSVTLRPSELASPTRFSQRNQKPSPYKKTKNTFSEERQKTPPRRQPKTPPERQSKNVSQPETQKRPETRGRGEERRGEERTSAQRGRRRGFGLLQFLTL